MNTYTKETFLKEFQEKGYVIMDNVIDQDYIKRASAQLEIALEKELEFVGTKDYKFYGYVLSNAKYGGAFLEIFDNKKITDPMNWVLGENCIIYSYTSSSMPPKMGNDSDRKSVG